MSNTRDLTEYTRHITTMWLDGLCTCDWVVCPTCEERSATHLRGCTHAAHDMCPIWEGAGVTVVRAGRQA